MIARVAVLPALLACVACAVLLPAAAHAQSGFVAEYTGELLDPDLRPISGVFPITFVLQRGADDGSDLWNETRYVAVDEGMYTVVLGRQTAIPQALAGDRLWLSVRIGGGEVAGQPFAPSPWVPDITPADQATIARTSFVDLAGHALHAERAGYARDCRTLGGTSVSQLDRYREMMSRVDMIRDDIDDASRVVVGLDRRTLSPTGGTGGRPYETVCPPGYVVTGARGYEGNVLDGVQFVCSQLLND